LVSNRIVGLFIGAFFRWNSVLESVCMWLMGCACVAGLSMLSHRHCPRVPWVRAVQITFAGALFFGLGQYATWLNPISIQWLSVELYLIAALLIAGCPWSAPWRYLPCMGLALMATYSSSNGLFCWLVILPVLLVHFPREQWRGLLPWNSAWALTAAVAIVSYFWGFRRPPESPGIVAGLEDPVRFAAFFLANIGSPFAFGTAVLPVTQSIVAGAAILGIVGWMGVRLYREADSEGLRELLPWAALAGYALLTGAAMTVGRAGFGPEEALASRYINTHVLTVIAIVFALPTVLDRWLSGGPASHRTAAIGACCTLVAVAALLHLFHSVWARQFFENHAIAMRSAKAAVLFIRSFTEPAILKPLWAGKTTSEVIDRVEFLDAKGWLRPPVLRSAAMSASATAAGRGAIEQSGSIGGNALGLSGWAFSTEHERAADAVVLSWEKVPEQAEAFALADMGLVREDLVQKFRHSGYRRAGWVKRFDASVLPKGNLTIRAWAFDTDTAQATRLDGSFVLQVK
jgi:hypothetical protein